MNRKLIITIIVFSFAMLELLAVRQGQINTANKMASQHREIEATNEKLNKLKIQIEKACAPSELQPILVQADELHEQQ